MFHFVSDLAPQCGKLHKSDFMLPKGSCHPQFQIEKMVNQQVASELRTDNPHNEGKSCHVACQG